MPESRDPLQLLFFATQKKKPTVVAGTVFAALCDEIDAEFKLLETLGARAQIDRWPQTKALIARYDAERKRLLQLERN